MGTRKHLSLPELVLYQKTVAVTQPNPSADIIEPQPTFISLTIVSKTYRDALQKEFDQYQ